MTGERMSASTIDARPAAQTGPAYVLSSLPVTRRGTVYHVGDLATPPSRRPLSYEGTGLSVSVHPEAWRRIAKLAGDVWALARPEGRGTFVDFYRLRARHKAALTAEAAARGLVEPCRVYVVTCMDEEGEECRIVFGPEERDRARAEAESFGEPGDDAGVTEEDGYRALPPLLGLWEDHFGNRQIPACLVLEFAWTVVLEGVGRYDGVWWGDRLDVPGLSAPRGVIFQSRLASWTRKRMSRWATRPPA